MGDAFGSSLTQTPRLNLQNLLSDLFVSGVYGQGVSHNPGFVDYLNQWASGGGGGVAPGPTALPPQTPPAPAPAAAPSTPGVMPYTGPLADLGVSAPAAPSATPTTLGDWLNSISLPGSTPQADTPSPGLPGPTGAGLTPQFNLGQFIQQMLSLPQYGGRLTAGLTPEQQAALGGAGGAASSFFGNQGGTAQQIIGGLLNQAGGAGGYVPSAIQSLLGNLPGQGALASIAGGAAPDFQSAFDALINANQAGFGRNLRDIREQYSAGGNRFGSDLAGALSTAGVENQNNLLSQLSQFGLQAAAPAAATRLGAASTLGQQGLGSADILSQLFGGQQSRVLQALQTLPGAQSTLATLPGQVAGNLYGLGEQARGVQDTDLQRLLAEFQRTQGALFPGVTSYAAGAPIISSPGFGTQLLGSGTALGAAALGAK